MGRIMTARTKAATHGATGGVTVSSFPTTLADTCRGFHVNGDGDVAVTFKDDTTATLTVKDGVYYPYQVATFTSFSGTSIIALK